MTITRRGVYHNLADSNYVASRGGVTFYFSSYVYQRKFFRELDEQRELFHTHMSKKIDGCFLNLDWLADIHLYKRIEKRGFYVEIGEVSVTWQELCRFASCNVTLRNTSDYVRTPFQR